MILGWLTPPRHLLALFFGVVVLLAAAFGWLSWRVIEQDRALGRQRESERRETAADAAVTALQRTIFEIIEQVRAGKPQADRTARMVVLRDAGVETIPPGKLLYYPVVPRAKEPPADQFSISDALEAKRDYPKALEFLAAATRSGDRAIRAGALLRVARIQRNAGQAEQALRTYEELRRMEGIRIAGEPLDLAARVAICENLERSGDKARLQREAASLHADLENGHWQLTRAVYTLYARKTARWVKPEERAEEVALAEVVDALWANWQQSRGGDSAQVEHVWIGDRPLFLFRHMMPDQLVVLAAGAKFVEDRWRERMGVNARGLQFSLTGQDGRALFGKLAGGAQTVRLPGSTSLPWTVQVATLTDAAGTKELAQRRQMVVGGLALMGLLIAVATYFIARAISREFALARLQSDFVSAVSHEFRTPLTTIRQLTEMLRKQRVPTEAKRDEYYELLAREGERLQKLVEDLLDFRRMEEGAEEFALEPLDPAGLLRGIVADFRQKANGSGYSVELTANGNSPPVRGDRESLRRAVWNLLENAVKYSPECRTIWVELDEEEKQVAIRVRDRGLGIPLQEQGAIFQKFVRGQQAKSSNIPGTGLGLAMVRQIARAHGGCVEVQSRPGEGSTFTLLLPAME